MGRGQFKSSIGFVLSAAGSAIGLGNIWGFPYKAAKYGGTFILIYLILIVIICLPLMLLEMSIGRKTRLNAYGAFKSIDRRFGWIGALGIIACSLVLSFYSVIGGWVMKYMMIYLSNLSGPGFGSNAGYFFSAFTGSAIEPLFWHILFMFITLAIVLKGIGGIEKASKFMMPALFLLLIILVARSLTLPGSQGWTDYFLTSGVNNEPLDEIILAAMGQALFSLSLGMGCMITYGSYVDKRESLVGSTFKVAGLDTLVALLAGAMILPVAFAGNIDPGTGPGLVFVTLPNLFGKMAIGGVLGFMFFILFLFAALTSSISMLEVPTVFFIDQLGWSRKKAAVTIAALMFLLGVPASLGNGAVEGLTRFTDAVKPGKYMTFMEALEYFALNILLPVGGFFSCLWAGWILPKSRRFTLLEEKPGLFTRFSMFIIKYIAPPGILIVFLNTIGVF